MTPCDNHNMLACTTHIERLGTKEKPEVTHRETEGWVLWRFQHT